MKRAGRRMVGVFAALGTVGAAVVMTSGAGTAAAAPAPMVPRSAGTVTADSLPTVQVDGVVWSQAIVGNTVYAGGSFANARPAGAAAGTNLVPRGNLLAFDITTGELITSFAPQLNGQVLSVAASPDGSRIYVTGDFTTADGQPRKRLAAYDTATGQLVASFNPKGPNSQGRAVVATNDVVYVGGGFAGSGSAMRGNLLAVRASDGVLLDWDPNADYTVSALALSTDAASVFVGGSFKFVGGQAAYGLAKVDASTGALQPWNATVEVRNAGVDAGVTSLRVDAGVVYGTTYHFGPGGNLEGPFAVSAGTGDLVWAADCHGDTYGAAVANGTVYVVGHAHYCGNVGEGFPQPGTWNFQRAQAFTQVATGTNLHEPLGYPKDWYGKPSPSTVHWLPTLTPGTKTGQSQAAWSVAASADYVVLGGEFPKVNGVGQQGLARFAKPALAPKLQGPALGGGSWSPAVVPTSTTSLRVSWKAAFDRDDRTLTYKVVRNDVFGSPVFQTSADSSWWNVPSLGFVDTGLTPGTAYKYRIVVSDPDGNTVYSTSTTVATPTAFEQSAHATAVLANAPSIYWPLTSAPVIAAGGFTDGSSGSTAAFAEPGIDAGTGVRLDGTANSRIAANGATLAPNTFTAQAWIKTTTTSGGRILGFGDLPTGSSNHEDRHVYMQNDGRVAFGLWAGTGRTSIVSPKAYNDGAWHQVTATFGAGGAALYVDGVRVAVRADLNQSDQYVGYWRVGGDDLNGWPAKPSKVDFTGSVDEVAVYPTALTQQQIIDQWAATGRTSPIPAPPADAYGAAVYADQPVLQWRLGEAGGTVAADSSASMSPGTYRGSGFTFGQAGAVAGTADSAVRSNGSTGFISSDAAYVAPQVYSLELWFNSTTAQGGKLIGFGNNKTGNSSTHDRHVYMQNDGKLVFGISDGPQQKITTARPYNDGTWHHVVATQSANGMALYVDGQLVGVRAKSLAANYTGYWRVGGDTTWGSTSRFLNGTLDDAAVYATALTPARVAEHYALAGYSATNVAPNAAFTSTRTSLTVAVDGTTSSDAEGPLASYAWDFGDGTSGTGATASKTYGAAGTYNVTLTVTDAKGVIDTETKQVTVAANQPPTATFETGSSFLDATFDSSASTDPDGTIVDRTWDFGDGTLGAGATASHTYDAAGTYTVTLTVTDDAGATATATKSVTIAANQPPTAAFTTSSAFLDAGFDGSGSLDPDGTITAWAWDFGDGSTGSGAVASHSYDASGTYTVTLTVTDGAGAITATSQDVTVVDNQAPTAAFTSSSSFLDAAFDASGSSDQDGTITAWAWDFGDGSTGSGAVASHPYAAAGTYTVTLTVTDDAGATAQITHDVTVDGQAIVAQDAMERSVTGGFGTADVGGAWTVSNVNNFQVGAGRGAFRINGAGGGASAFLNATSVADVDAAIDVSYDKVATGGGFYTSLVVRRVGTSDYRAKLRVTPTGTQLHLARTVNGVETVLASGVVPGTFAPGQVLHLQFQVDGSGTTNLAATAWYDGAAPPTTWTVTATDATPGLQGPGAVGVYGYVSGSATNAPVTTFVDELWVGAR